MRRKDGRWFSGTGGGGFQYCRLSEEPLFDADGAIRKDVTFAQLAEFVWFMETGAGRSPSEALPLGVRKSSAFPGSELIDSGGSAADLSGGKAAEKVATDGEAKLRRTSSGTAAKSTDPKSSGTAARDGSFGSPLLGVLNGKAVFLLYNGILKERSDVGGNVLNSRTLRFLDSLLPDHDGKRVVYAARSRFDKKKLASLGITFHQLPYDLAAKTWF